MLGPLRRGLCPFRGARHSKHDEHCYSGSYEVLQVPGVLVLHPRLGSIWTNVGTVVSSRSSGTFWPPQ